MSQTLLWNFVVPNGAGIIAVLGVAWLYVLNDYFSWRIFWTHKYRARVFSSAKLTLFCHGAIVALWYGLCVFTGEPGASGGAMPWFIRLAVLLMINAIVVALLYKCADDLVAKRGGLGPRRPRSGATESNGYPVMPSHLGGGHHI